MSSQLLILPIFGRAAAGIRDPVKALTHPRLLLIYAVTALGYGGVFGIHLHGADDAGFWRDSPRQR